MSSGKAKEARLKPRQERNAKVKIHWHDAYGVLKSAVATSEDVSRTGIKLSLDKPIPARTLINVQCPDLRLSGVAVVRHCQRSTVNSYIIGCEFAAGMEWREGQ